MLHRALGQLPRGFYIDVGANDPSHDSVTRLFYEKGWCGINMEPLQSHFDDLQRERPRDINLHCAAGSSPGEIELWECDVRGWATANRAVIATHLARGYEGKFLRIPVTTLTAVCERYAPQEIHFLKIDVEGFERAVLEGIDFTRFRPWIVVVEATHPNSKIENYAHWEELLTVANYRFVYADGLNRFYLSSEHSGLSEAFRYPPNLFDDFVKVGQIMAEAYASQAEIRANQAEKCIVEIESRVTHAENLAIHAETRADHAETNAARAEARTTQSENRATQAEAYVAHAEWRITQAETRATQAEAYAAQTEWRVTQAETRATQAEAYAAQTEWRITQAEMRAIQAEAYAAQAEWRITQAEIRTTQAETYATQLEERTARAEKQAALFEVRALDAEARAAQIELDAARTETRAVQAENAAAQLEEWRSSAEARTQRAELFAAQLINSTSWRITAPLRQLSAALRDMRSISWQSLPGTLLQSGTRFVITRPKLRIIAARVLARFPRLKSRLVGALTSSATNSVPDVPEKLAHLSPREQRIYWLLKEAQGRSG